MFIVSQFLQSKQTTQEIVQVGPEIAGDDSPPNPPEVTQESAPPIIPDAPKPSSENTMSGFQNFGANEDMRAMLNQLAIQELKAKFGKIFDENDPKLEQLLALSSEKIERDGDLMDMLSANRSLEDNQKLTEIMVKDENELTLEEQALKQAQLDASERYLEAVEQSRIDFEDSAKNLLSLKELEQLRKQEQETSQKNHERHLKALRRNIQLDGVGLNSFQKTQIEQLWSSHLKRQVENVPLGSTITFGVGGINSSSGKYVQELYSDLDNILTSEQMTAFRSNPLLMMD